MHALCIAKVSSLDRRRDSISDTKFELCLFTRPLDILSRAIVGGGDTKATRGLTEMAPYHMVCSSKIKDPDQAISSDGIFPLCPGRSGPRVSTSSPCNTIPCQWKCYHKPADDNHDDKFNASNGALPPFNNIPPPHHFSHVVITQTTTKRSSIIRRRR